MSASNQQAEQPARSRGPGRRIAAAVIITSFVFLALWLMVFGFVTSLIVASTCCAVVIVASVAWDPLEMVLDILATILFGVLAVVGAILGAIFSLFDW